MIRVLVWNENYHEKTSEKVAAVYPDGIHNAIAALKNSDYIQRPSRGRSPASGRSDELEKPAYRAAQCE